MNINKTNLIRITELNILIDQLTATNESLNQEINKQRTQRAQLDSSLEIFKKDNFFLNEVFFF